MKLQEIKEIIKEISNNKELDEMSIKDMRELLILLTGIITGVLVTSKHSKEEIISLVK